MEKTSRRIKKAQIAQSDCVSCGCCVKVCPRDALSIVMGLFAAVDDTRCIGCGKCAKECPASIIELKEVAS